DARQAAGTAPAARHSLAMDRRRRTPRRRLRRRCRTRRSAPRQPGAGRSEDNPADPAAVAARAADGHGHRPQVIGLDRRFERWVVEHRVSWLNGVFEWISNLGEFGWIFLVVALCAALVLRRPQIVVLTLSADL